MSIHVTLTPRDLTPVEADTVADLITDALPDFYGALPQDSHATRDMIAAEMATEGTECHRPLIAESDGKIVGMVCAFPLAELQTRQQASMLHIMRSLDGEARKAFRQAMRQNNHGVAPITTTDGVYIARIAVAPAARGTGIGQQMFNALQARHERAPTALHVDRENEQAIRFYTRQGFTFTDDDSVQKKAMLLG